MDKKKVLLSILGIFVLVLATVGVTFAVFTYTKLGTTENVVTTGTLKFLYTENTGVGNGINISDALPVSDEVGKSYSTENYVFDFSVEATNSGVDEIPYEVTLRKKSASTLNESNVKVYLTDMTEQTDIKLAGPILYSDLGQTIVDVGDEIEKTIYNGTVLGRELNYKKDFRLRMWVDESSNYDSISGKTFTVLVNVYSNTKVVTDGPVYYSINEVLNSYDESELKETVMCSSVKNGDVTRYYDCGIYNTIEESLASRTKGTVIVTNDLNRDKFIFIDEGKKIDLEVNNHTITFTSTYGIRNSGTLNLNKETTGTIIGESRPILIYGLTNVYNGQFINTKVENDGGATFVVSNNINTTGSLNIYGEKVTFDESGNYISGVYIKGADNSCLNITGGEINIYDGTIEMMGSLAAIRSNYNGTVTINMYGGEVVAKGNGIGLDPNCPETTEINIYDGDIRTEQYWSIYNNSLATINVYGGSFASNNNYTILNRSDGIINIKQIEKPIYITTLSQVWSSAITNNSTGTLNISGNEANKCTNSPSDTTSGLCVYAEGDKNYSTSTANTAVSNVGAGTINISGGTMYGGNNSIQNHYDGTVNIAGGVFISNYLTIINSRTGITNICNAKISSSNVDLWASTNTTTGTINYSSNVIFTNGNNTPVVGGVTANIIPNYTGTCDTE